MPQTAAVTVVRAHATGPFRVREIVYTAGHRQPVHAHASTSVSVIVAGAIAERACRAEEMGTALSVVVKPAGVMHSDEIGPRGARTLQLEFDMDAACELLGEGVELDRWQWLHGRAVAGALLAVLRMLRGPASAADALEDGILEGLGAVAASRGRARGPAPDWLHRVREALDDDIHRNHPVRELARMAGAHPVSLSRAFARHYGCSVTEYRRRERLRRASACLEGTTHGISRIAHSAGYADHAHLCREFRAAAGLSPSGFRTLARTA